MIKRVFTIIGFALFFHCHCLLAGDAVVLQLKWHHQFQFAGYYAAVEKGFYENQGLNVKILEGKPNLFPIDQVVNGSAHFGIAGPEILLQKIKGKPVVVLAAVFQHSPRVIMVRKEAGIRSVQDLAGRTIAMGRQVDMMAENYAMLLMEGVSLQSLNIVEDFNLNEFISGRTDAYSCYRTVQPFLMEKQGIAYSLFRPESYGIDFYGDCLFTSESEIKNHPERASAFKMASLKGWEYALEHPQEIIDLIIEKYGKADGKSDSEHLKYEAEKMRALIKPELIKIGHINPGRWRHIANAYEQLGVIEKPFSLEGFIYEPDQALPIWKHRLVWWGLGLSLFITFAVFFLYYNNLRISREISEKRKTEAALRESQNELKQTLEATTDGIWSWNFKTGQLFFSPKYYEMLGYEPDAFSATYDSWVNLLHPVDKNGALKIAQAYMKTKPDTYDNEFRMKTSNGEYRWIHAHGRVVERDEKGNAVYMIGNHRDITERKQTEQSLKQLEWMLTRKNAFKFDMNNLLPSYGNIVELNRTRIILDSVGETLLKEIVGDYLDLLDTSAAVYEADGQYALGIFASGWCRFMDEASRQQCNTSDNREAMRCGKWLCHESCWTQASKPAIDTGGPVDIPCNGGIHLYALPIFAGDKIVGAINMGYGDPPDDDTLLMGLALKYGVDVEALREKAKNYESRPLFIIELAKRRLQTSARLIGEIVERKQTENALQKSDERLKLALDSVSDAVWDWQIDTGDIYFSSRWYTMIGYEPDELPKNFSIWETLLHPADVKKFNQTITRHLKLADPFELEVRLRNKDGDYRWILARGKTVSKDEDGKAARMLGTNMDITDRKRMEARMLQSQKMESIGHLSSGIAHDFNNILFPIVGLSEMLMEDLQPGSMVHENALEIFEAGKRGSELVKQILAFSRQSESKKVPTRLKQIVKEVLKLCRASIPAQIDIHYDIEAECGTVMADPIHLHQIGMNLMTNAFHAVDQTCGKITVELKQIVLKEDHVIHGYLGPGEYVRLSVSDNGVGIQKEAIGFIFEPYYTTKKEGKGTGLGLAVVYGIVKDYKGDIEIISEPGKGTTVHVYLPVLSKEMEDFAADHQDTHLETGSETILLVDDEPPVVRLERQILERLGYQVVAKTSSQDALETFKENPYRFDLVLTDFSMPYLTGIQLAEKVHSMREDTPIILCTGFSERINQYNTEDVGIKDVVMKPVAGNEMAAVVRRVLDDTS